jgi:uncharacterized OsmC-like protein
MQPADPTSDLLAAVAGCVKANIRMANVMYPIRIVPSYDL